MKALHISFKNRNYLLSLLIILGVFQFSFGQLSGPTAVLPNSTHSYSYNDGFLHMSPSWEITGGILLSSTVSGLTYSAEIQWGVAGTGTVKFKSGRTVKDTLTVTISPSASSALSDENYVYVITPQFETSDTATLLDSLKMESVTYYDGLGRPMQSIGIRAGGDQEDIITHMEYDALSRQEKEYLSYAKTLNEGLYNANADISTINFYNKAKYENTLNPYSEKLFERTPLHRVLKQASPASDWAMDNGHEIRFDYLTNTATEVKYYGVDLTLSNDIYNPTLVGGMSYYDLGQLTKTITKDENWISGTNHTTEEFKDKQGRVVLKRTYNNIPYDTYYVYDDYGNLTYVLPPKSEPHSDKPNSTELAELCYQYKYDHRNRLVEKKIPGKGWEYIVYNKLDQPIMTQDGNLKAQNKWLFTKYDAFGRVAFTGITNSNASRSQMQSDANNTTIYVQYVSRSSTPTAIDGINVYYNNNNTFPNSVSELLTVNYYDDYNVGLSTEFNVQNPFSQDLSTNNSSLATVSMVRVLDVSPSKWITSVTYYDNKARPIYVYNKNDYLDTTDAVATELDFTGKALEVQTTHSKSGNTISTVDNFNYDHAGRLLSHKQQIDTEPEELIVLNEYDELGQLTSKRVGGAVASPIENSIGLQTVDFDYNVRGWLTDINKVDNLGSDLFGFQLHYNNPTHGSAHKLFNGNISQANWATKSQTTTKLWYMYHYDALNRITKAQFAGAGWWDRFSLQNVTYDKNGNIESLIRKGNTNAAATTFGTMDNLVYTYETSSNKLKKVLDNSNNTNGFRDGSNTTTEFTYDANGNLLSDANKGITNITYNHLNLPISVSINGNGNVGTISYFYDATGVKVKKVVNESGQSQVNTEYAGNYIYIKVGTGLNELQFFNHPEGYVEPDGSGFDYIYQYKDHLGNIRLSYKDINGNYQNILDSDFEDSFDGWEENGSVNYSLDNGRLKANVNSPWEGVRHPLTGVITQVGESLTVKVNFDKGNTQSNVRLYLPEYNPSGTLVSYNVLTNNLQSGYSEHSLTMTNSGNSIGFVRIDKDNTNTSTETYFYIDHVSLIRNDLEIVEENNYYPFGLKHKGYNNVQNGRDHKFEFQGQEIDEELGLNWQSFKYRNYDPAIGRFFNVDPLAEDYNYQSPYNFAENRVIDGIELEGLEWKSIKDEETGNTNLQLTVQLYNDAILTDKQLTKLKTSLTEQFGESFSGTGFTGELIIEDAAKAEGDFLVTLTEKTAEIIEIDGKEYKKYKGGKAGKGGESQKNSFDVTAKVDGEERSNSSISRSFFHEAGHTAGLWHPWSNLNTVEDIKQGATGVTAKTIKNNLMNTDDNTTIKNRSHTGRSLTSGQLKSIDKIITGQQ
jgi:RHS repeat-associated protein